jgi:hypothetical protein
VLQAKISKSTSVMEIVEVIQTFFTNVVFTNVDFTTIVFTNEVFTIVVFMNIVFYCGTQYMKPVLPPPPPPPKN